MRLPLPGIPLLLLAACVEPSQARVTETPEQLLIDKDCGASYKSVKGTMPGAGVKADDQYPRQFDEDPMCAGSKPPTSSPPAPSAAPP